MFRSPDDEDRRLLVKIVRQDERSLRALMERHQRLIYGLSLRVLGSQEDAEEVAIEVFLKIWRKAELFQGNCSVKSFLCRLAVNECRDRLRRQVKYETLSDGPSSESKDERLTILCALRYLEVEDRLAIVLYHIDGFSIDEVAGVLNVTPGALKMRLVRVRAKLKKILEDEYERFGTRQTVG